MSKNKTVKLSAPTLVCAPKMTDAVARWGVYAIPRMWREPDGTLIVRLNGEEDSADVENMHAAPNLYFSSSDDGESWHSVPDGDERYDISVLTGIDPPYLRRADGETLYFQYEKGLRPIHDAPSRKEFLAPCGDAVLRTWRFGDIPSDAKGLFFGRIRGGREELFRTEIDFPSREVAVNAFAKCADTYLPVEPYLQPFLFKLPYLCSLTELSDGTLVALATGQNPSVCDRYCSEVYLLASTDGGRTFRYRSTVASDAFRVPYGYGGDGGEVSMTRDACGNLFVVMRMDMSIHPDCDEEKLWSAMLCVSRDGGFAWSTPRAVADSSVTPHIVALDGDVLLLIYGRPGVHCKISTDGGSTFGEPHSIIGKTLDEERALGRSDFESKYANAVSYSNVFYEKLSGDTVLVCYSDLTYPDENGIPTKAAFVRRITVADEKE